MMFNFDFLGKNSFDDFGLLVETRPIISKPQRNIDYIQIPGRSGSLKVDYETYNDIVIPVTCSFLDDHYVADRADDIKAWLDGGEGDLIFSNQLDKKYIAHVSDQIDITQELRILGKFLVNFRCKPFKYSVNNDVITLPAAGIITNPGTAESEPIITVYGIGSIDLTINANTIHLTNVVDYVTIDSVLMDCYKDTALQNNNMLGGFPKLQPGDNIMSWTGTVTKIEITPNWRWL